MQQQYYVAVMRISKQLPSDMDTIRNNPVSRRFNDSAYCTSYETGENENNLVDKLAVRHNKLGEAGHSVSSLEAMYLHGLSDG